MFNAEGKDSINIFAIDISKSMIADDIRPNRLEFIKKNLANFIKSGFSGRVSIILFSSNASVFIPVTDNTAAVPELISSVEPSLISAEGTDINSIFPLIEKTVSENPVKIINAVILSDGENFGNSDFLLNKKKSSDTLKISAIATGTSTGAFLKNKNGKYLVDSSGQKIFSKMNPDILYKISRKFNGKFFKVSSSVQFSEALKSIIIHNIGNQAELRFLTYNKFNLILLSVSFTFFIFNTIIKKC
jgi:Ca-activated chloride channel family protein